MSSNLMDTQPGGEQTQYEGEHTFVEPHAKQSGQLGDPAKTTTTPNTSKPGAATNEPNTVGITPAEKIRYGQSIQEAGMGGKTTEASGEAVAEGGFGGTEKLSKEDESSGKEGRKEQGYGGARDMDKEVGA